MRQNGSCTKQQQQQLQQQQHGFQQLWEGSSCRKFHMHCEANVQQHCWQQHRELYPQHTAATELDARLLELLILREKLTANAVTAEEAIQAVAAATAVEISRQPLQQHSYSAQALVLQSSSNGSSSSSRRRCSSSGSDLCYSSMQQQLQRQQLCLCVAPELMVPGAGLQRSPSKQTAAVLCQSGFGTMQRTSSLPVDTATAGAVQGPLKQQQQQQQQQQQCQHQGSAAAGAGGWLGDSARELGMDTVLRAAEQRIWQLEELQQVRFTCVLLDCYSVTHSNFCQELTWSSSSGCTARWRAAVPQLQHAAFKPWTMITY
jgi:hypothetical protein